MKVAWPGIRELRSADDPAGAFPQINQATAEVHGLLARIERDFHP
jgi:hypothetical protein